MLDLGAQDPKCKCCHCQVSWSIHDIQVAHGDEKKSWAAHKRLHARTWKERSEMRTLTLGQSSHNADIKLLYDDTVWLRTKAEDTYGSIRNLTS